MMSDLKRPARFRAHAALVLAVLLGCAGFAGRALAANDGRPVPDTFVATTTGMSPAGVELKVNVLEWSDESARAAALAALTDSDVAASLAQLPSVGVVWRSGSSVGHSLKYAHREATEDGGQRITVVTDKPIDSYSFEPWEVEGHSREAAPAYTVIELLLDQSGSGSGTLSLAAEVRLDTAAAEVTLTRTPDAPAVLTDARELPKPYWARTD